MRILRGLSRKMAPVAGDLPDGAGRGFASLPRPALSLENNMNPIEMKIGGYALYDIPPKLKAFLMARESGNASKELMMQLSADAMAEQERERSKMPRATLIDFQRARLERERTEGK
jgi:hypothetical protein